MPADRKDLERRLAAATPKDTVRGFIFECVFDVAREHGGDELARRCDPAGKGSRVDFFSYPIADFLRAAWDAADALEKTLPFDDALRAMGVRAGGKFLQSSIGKTLVKLVGIEPRQLMSGVPSAYKSVVSYGERTVAWVGERHARHTFKRDFLVPAYHCGVLEGALRAVGAKASATGKATGFLEAVYDVTWE